ncbi:hypothetical protein M3Y97_00744600 [Aphelenchoides bicaudatus]|nr:hypothetical protein M3Y97_00744600 [Aphelenchoides bicaudatus]
MFNFTNYDFASQTGPSSAPPNPQANIPNHFAFPSYFTQPLAFYNQLNQQLNSYSYAPVPSPATINSLANSFQQQQFNSPTGFTTPATTPVQSQVNTFFAHQQPSTSSVQPAYQATNNVLNNFQQGWTQSSPAWPQSNLNTQNASTSFYDLNNALFTSNNAIQQFVHNDLPTTSVTTSVATNPFWVPRKTIEKTVVLIQKQNPYTLNWSEKTCKMYFRKWFDSTFNINIRNLDACKVMIKPDFIVGFFVFDAHTAKHLVNVFSDGNTRNDVLLKSASDFLIESMAIHKHRNGSTTQINNVDDAVNALSEIKSFRPQYQMQAMSGPLSAPPYYTNPFGRS